MINTVMTIFFDRLTCNCMSVSFLSLSATLCHQPFFLPGLRKSAPKSSLLTISFIITQLGKKFHPENNKNAPESVGNGTDYARITAVADGTMFAHVATAANGWHAVKVGSQVGWVSGKYSKITTA